MDQQARDRPGPRLRPVGGATRVLSDTQVREALFKADLKRPIPDHTQQAVRAICFVLWTIAHREAERRGQSIEAVSLDCEPIPLARITGVSETVLSSALTTATQARILGEDSAGVRFLGSEIVTEPFCHGLDWDWILQVGGGSTGRVLLARAVAGNIIPPHEWTAVRQSTLVNGARVSGSTAARGLTAFVEEGILERQRQAGRADLYRFNPRAMGQAEDAEATHASVAIPAMSEGSQDTSPNTSMSINGIPLDVPRGSKVRVQIDDQGRHSVTVWT